jgi:hypothetical protein
VKVWTQLTPDQIREVAAEIGVKIHSDWYGGGITRDGRAWRFRLALNSDVPKKESGYKYQRTSASAFHEGRRVAAVCWHGHRDFMLALYARDPEARIKTAWADYRGVRDFAEKFGNTGYRNVGSLMYPMFAKDICTCSWGDWDVDSGIGGSYAVQMPQSMIGGCPFVIFQPDHYRADGSCKCDDPHERKKMIEEWEYSEEDFEGIPLREVA